jgi:hypothetical protein
MSGCGKIRADKFVLGLLALGMAVVLGSCSSPVNIESFDEKVWKSDTNACKNARTLLLGTILNNKKAIISFKDEKIMDYLGKPDNTIYFARGKKTLIYSINPNRACPNFVLGSTPKSLRIDIDGLGRAELVYVLNQ